MPIGSCGSGGSYAGIFLLNARSTLWRRWRESGAEALNFYWPIGYALGITRVLRLINKMVESLSSSRPSDPKLCSDYGVRKITQTRLPLV
jgi:hypothetical protein